MFGMIVSVVCGKKWIRSLFSPSNSIPHWTHSRDTGPFCTSHISDGFWFVVLVRVCQQNSGVFCFLVFFLFVCFWLEEVPWSLLGMRRKPNKSGLTSLDLGFICTMEMWSKVFSKGAFSRDSNECLWCVLLLYHVQGFPWEPPPIRGKSQI